MTKSVRTLPPFPRYVICLTPRIAACCCNTVAFQLSMLCMKCVSHSRYMRVSDTIATAANTSLCPEISALALTLVRLPNVGRVGCVQWVYLPAPGTYNPFYLQTCGAGTNNS